MACNAHYHATPTGESHGRTAKLTVNETMVRVLREVHKWNVVDCDLAECGMAHEHVHGSNYPYMVDGGKETREIS